MRYGPEPAEINQEPEPDPKPAFVCEKKRDPSIVEIMGETYKCNACGFVRKYTPAAVQKHLDAKTYKSCHDRYVQALL